MFFRSGNLQNIRAEDYRDQMFPQAGKGAAIPFNSSNKWQVSVHEVRESQLKGESAGDSIVAIKGAPERILAMCEYYWYKGERLKLENDVREQIKNLNTGLAKKVCDHFNAKKKNKKK